MIVMGGNPVSPATEDDVSAVSVANVTVALASITAGTVTTVSNGAAQVVVGCTASQNARDT
jgi:hypothetical protein